MRKKKFKITLTRNMFANHGKYDEIFTFAIQNLVEVQERERERKKRNRCIVKFKFFLFGRGREKRG